MSNGWRFGSGRDAPPGKGDSSGPAPFDDKTVNNTNVQACKQTGTKIKSTGHEVKFAP